MKTSVLMRLGVMALIFVGLLIPLSMTGSLVAERAARRDAAVTAVGAMWGGAQILAGPVLTVPYRCSTTAPGGARIECRALACFLPDSLEIDGVVDPEVRRRDLFEAVVYRARIKVTARFARPAVSDLTPLPVEMLWHEATIAVGVSDPKGVTRRFTLVSNGTSAEFEAGVPDLGIFSAGMHAAAGLQNDEQIPGRVFSFEVQLHGTRDLKFLATGRNSVVKLSSSWPHPSFIGSLLPESREMSAGGFSAAWATGAFGTALPSRWSIEAMPAQLRVQAAAADFGVSLLQPVDIYQQTYRAVKYAVLFIVLTFSVGFVWEVTRRIQVHPVQYLFVGFALCIFYLLLLSLSEHAGFDRAYATASVATVALLGWYWRWVAGGATKGGAMALILAALYGFLYLLLRLEDYALVAGSVGVFVILAVLMYITRRVNWFGVAAQEEQH